MIKTDKWLGTSQREILDKITVKPCSKNEILDLTGLSNSVVTNALNSMIKRGIITKSGVHYVITRE